jgi:hypothetical protein
MMMVFIIRNTTLYVVCTAFISVLLLQHTFFKQSHYSSYTSSKYPVRELVYYAQSSMVWCVRLVFYWPDEINSTDVCSNHIVSIPYFIL